MANEIIPADFAIAKYLQIERACEREELKEKMLFLRGMLGEKDILFPIDFTPYGKGLCSETFNRGISFLQSCGIVNEQRINEKIVYAIDPDGEERIVQYPKISDMAARELDCAINDVVSGKRLA